MKQHIITHLTDTDLYKFTVQRIFLKNFIDATGRYEFVCRNPDVTFTHEQVMRIKDEINNLCNLRFTRDELDFIRSIDYLGASWYVEFLRNFQLNSEYIDIKLDENGKLHIVAEGSLYHVMFFEVFILSIVNEVYFDSNYPNQDMSEAKNILNKNIRIAKISKFKFSDFGTRRRFSKDWHDYVIKTLVETKQKESWLNFAGTSNVYFAMKYGINCYGTFGHEFPMAMQGLSEIPVANSQSYALDIWIKTYGSSLGCCLTDTMGWQKFSKDFNEFYAKLFNGVRIDSGDNYEIANKIIRHCISYLISLHFFILIIKKIDINSK